MQQPMYTGLNQSYSTSAPQPLLPQESYGQQQQPQQQWGTQQQQQPQQQLWGTQQQPQQGQWGAQQQTQQGSWGTQQQPQQGQWGAQMNSGYGQMGYQPTGMNAPSQAHAQTAAMAGNGFSAFDPFSPTGGPPQAQQVSQPQASQHALSSYATPTATGPVNNAGSRTALFAGRGDVDQWIANCLASRRADLGPPVQPPRTFAESYRKLMDQAYENILRAIADVSCHWF